MTATPQYVLLAPQCEQPSVLEVALGVRAHWAAALFSGGVDIFAPTDLAVDGREDPRVTTPGARGQALCRHGLRPTPTAFISWALASHPAGYRGTIRVLDGLDLTEAETLEFTGSAALLAEFFEEALSLLLEHAGSSLPLDWAQLLGVRDEDEAMDVFAGDGAAELTRIDRRVTAANLVN